MFYTLWTFHSFLRYLWCFSLQNQRFCLRLAGRFLYRNWTAKWTVYKLGVLFVLLFNLVKAKWNGFELLLKKCVWFSLCRLKFVKAKSIRRFWCITMNQLPTQKEPVLNFLNIPVRNIQQSLIFKWFKLRIPNLNLNWHKLCCSIN